MPLLFIMAAIAVGRSFPDDLFLDQVRDCGTGLSRTYPKKEKVKKLLCLDIERSHHD